jgi:probable rRNA maturation factor
VSGSRARPTIHVAVDGNAAPLSRTRAQSIVAATLRAEKVPSALISVAFLSNRAIAAMNRKHLRHSGATDVISFGFERASEDAPVVGDIYIAPEVARRNAGERGVAMAEELTRLLVHGTLHVLGYDHPDSDAREQSAMWKRQEQLVRRFRART